MRYISSIFKRRFDLKSGIVISFLIALLLNYIRIWQTALIAGFIVGVIAKKRGVTAGFIGVALSWAVALIILSSTNPVVPLLMLFVQILRFPPSFYWLPPTITVLIGGLLGALGASISVTAYQLLTAIQARNPPTAPNSHMKKEALEKERSRR